MSMQKNHLSTGKIMKIRHPQESGNFIMKLSSNTNEEEMEQKRRNDHQRDDCITTPKEQIDAEPLKKIKEGMMKHHNNSTQCQFQPRNSQKVYVPYDEQ